MNLSQLESILEDDGIVFLTYGGFLSQPLIVAMTEALEQETKANNLSMKVAHNLFTIFIELSQNVMNYSKKTEKHDPKGLILVGYDQAANTYYVLSRNVVSVEDKETITPKLDQIMSLDKDELKTLYRKLRKSGRGKHEKGAGIGFVEIARRCNKLEYSFTKNSESSYYFSLKTLIYNY